MSSVHVGDTNLMVSLCRDLDQCRRRSLQIEYQCAQALSRCLVARLRSEQRNLAARVAELHRVVMEIRRFQALESMSVAFLAELARRSRGSMLCSLG